MHRWICLIYCLCLATMVEHVEREKKTEKAKIDRQSIDYARRSPPCLISRIFVSFSRKQSENRRQVLNHIRYDVHPKFRILIRTMVVAKRTN